jgi:predicted ATPase
MPGRRAGRIRKQLYEAIDPQRRLQEHLHIGRILREQGRSDPAFDAVFHLNR